MRSSVATIGAIVLLLSACKPAPGPRSDAKTAPVASASGGAEVAHPAPPSALAAVGEPAPDLTLKDYEGKSYKLSELRGKTVVLEWFNPQCPFVKASHTLGSLRDTPKRYLEKGVVWLAINSAAPGKQGHDVAQVDAARKKLGLSYPVLVDETGAVGHLYHATNTPQMFVIDPQGKLVYRGAIDNSPDGEGQSPAGGKLVNYVDAALQDLAAGRPVQTPDTKPYGCSVKYGS